MLTSFSGRFAPRGGKASCWGCQAGLLQRKELYCFAPSSPHTPQNDCLGHMTAPEPLTGLGLDHMPSPVAKPEGLCLTATLESVEGGTIPIKQRSTQLPEEERGLAGQADAITAELKVCSR